LRTRTPVSHCHTSRAIYCASRSSHASLATSRLFAFSKRPGFMPGHLFQTRVTATLALLSVTGWPRRRYILTQRGASPAVTGQVLPSPSRISCVFNHSRSAPRSSALLKASSHLSPSSSFHFDLSLRRYRLSGRCWRSIIGSSLHALRSLHSLWQPGCRRWCMLRRLAHAMQSPLCERLCEQLFRPYPLRRC
jgi:hypothetical protein